MSTEDDVGRLAAVLPEVSEKPCYGRPGFYVAGKIFARLHEQPGVLVCWLPGLDDKEALLAADPEVFFTTDHYRGHASVLVRLERIGTPELEELLRESWSCRAPRRLRQDAGTGDDPRPTPGAPDPGDDPGAPDPEEGPGPPGGAPGPG